MDRLPFVTVSITRRRKRHYDGPRRALQARIAMHFVHFAAQSMRNTLPTKVLAAILACRASESPREICDSCDKEA
jgi:hypothetical protein